MPTTNPHQISLQVAIEMTSLYREKREDILDASYRGQNILPLSETFDKYAFQSFFENTDCKALRIYYGMDESLQTHAVIVGVNAENEDMLPSAERLLEDEDDPNIILELSIRCPPDPNCPESSPLNTP